VYKDVCGIHLPGSCFLDHELLKKLSKYCSQQAVSFTHMLREFLRNVEENTLAIYKEDGLVNFEPYNLQD
jgi:hypothetical protein